MKPQAESLVEMFKRRRRRKYIVWGVYALAVLAFMGVWVLIANSARTALGPFLPISSPIVLVVSVGLVALQVVWLYANLKLYDEKSIRTLTVSNRIVLGVFIALYVFAASGWDWFGLGALSLIPMGAAGLVLCLSLLVVILSARTVAIGVRLASIIVVFSFVFFYLQPGWIVADMVWTYGGVERPGGSTSSRTGTDGRAPKSTQEDDSVAHDTPRSPFPAAPTTPPSPERADPEMGWEGMRQTFSQYSYVANLVRDCKVKNVTLNDFAQTQDSDYIEVHDGSGIMTLPITDAPRLRQAVDEVNVGGLCREKGTIGWSDERSRVVR